jgi:predicted transcriptional regulator
MTKEKIHQAVDELPNEFSVEDLLEKIIFLHKIERGYEQSEKGEVVSTEEARKKLSKWLQ